MPRLDASRYSGSCYRRGRRANPLARFQLATDAQTLVLVRPTCGCARRLWRSILGPLMFLLVVESYGLEGVSAGAFMVTNVASKC